MASVHDEDEFMLITQQGKILRTVARDIRTIGRATQGVRLIEIDADDRVVALARLAEREDETEPEETP
jgi:DNA gyrase subunit A